MTGEGPKVNPKVDPKVDAAWYDNIVATWMYIDRTCIAPLSTYVKDDDRMKTAYLSIHEFTEKLKHAPYAGPLVATAVRLTAFAINNWPWIASAVAAWMAKSVLSSRRGGGGGGGSGGTGKHVKKHVLSRETAAAMLKDGTPPRAIAEALFGGKWLPADYKEANAKRNVLHYVHHGRFEPARWQDMTEDNLSEELKDVYRSRQGGASDNARKTDVLAAWLGGWKWSSEQVKEDYVRALDADPELKQRVYERFTINGSEKQQIGDGEGDFTVMRTGNATHIFRGKIGGGGGGGEKKHGNDNTSSKEKKKKGGANATLFTIPESGIKVLRHS